MKRLIIPVLMLLAGACTNYIDYDFSQVKPELMVLGWLDASTTSQTVSVSLSEGGLVKLVEEATVTCYVNGEPVAVVSATPEEEKNADDDHSFFSSGDQNYYRQLPVSFSATFKPGDKVRLTFEANHGTYRASSPELTVPGAVEITKLDTARVTVTHLDYSDRYLQIRADVPDRKDEDNWYCITLHNVTDGTFSYKDGRPDLFASTESILYIRDLDDPILLDGNMGQSEDLNLFDFSGNGEFACFSDQMFRDGTAHLKMNSFSSWSDEGANFYGLRRDLYKNYGYDAFNEELDKCRAEHRLEVHLSHCSQDAYYYLRSLRTISSEGYDPRIVEPVTVPSNIIDGIGYVDIVNTTVARIELPAEEEHYPIEDFYF